MFCNDLDSCTQIARIANPIVALLGLFFIWLQLNTNARQSKRERTYIFADRYYDPQYVNIFLSAKKFATEKSSNFEDFKTNSIIRKNVGITINFFEELGYLYESNLVDHAIIEDLLGDASIETYKIYEWIICEIRKEQKENNPNIPSVELYCKSWEKMNQIVFEKKKITLKNWKEWNT